MTTPQQARELAKNLRTKPTPLSVVVPVLQSLADQVEALRAELESWRLTNRIDELQRAHDIYKKDAERYRWLRNRMPGQAYRVAGIIYGEISEVDKQIDAAIAKGTAND